MGKLIDADKLARRIAGHSDYHGDSILSAIYCMAEGQVMDVPIAPIKRKRRKIATWIKEVSPFGWDGHSYQCSECGRSIHLFRCRSGRFGRLPILSLWREDAGGVQWKCQ